MRGHLVLADISGYTRFLTDSELEHANGIMGELLNSIIEAIDAPLEISRIEGDAVFMHGVVPEGMSGLAVLETVEHTYVAFRGALETMVLNTSCQCNACVNIASLGLKIVMHCGEFAVTKVGPMTTLSGSDVITAHRLLKNTVRETTGIDDYLLVTQACVDDLGLERLAAKWVPHTESYDDVGAVDGYVASLAESWEAMRSRTKVKVAEDDAWMTWRIETTAPPAVLWDHLTDPLKRTAWLGANSNEVFDDEDGRIGPGASYHCAHGPENTVVVFTVLDRRALEYLTYTIPVDDTLAVRLTDYVVPTETGSELVTCCGYPYRVATGEPLSPLAAAAHEEGLGWVPPTQQALIDLAESAVLA
jgi:hypothetical protein